MTIDRPRETPPLPQARLRAHLRVRLATVSILCLLVALPLLAETATLTEWPLPDPDAGPAFLALDGTGGLWFTQQDAARLGHFDPETGTLRQWRDPSPFSNYGLSVAEDGAVWFAVWSRGLLRFDPATHRFESFDIPTSFPIPYMVHADREVCTGQYRRQVVACLDPDERLWTEWHLPAGLTKPNGLVVDLDGSLWIGLDGGRRIARLDRATNVLTAWTLPGAGPVQLQIAQDVRGRIWFPLADEGAVGRLDPSTDAVELHRLPEPSAAPFALALDLLGRVWITDPGGDDALVRLDPAASPAQMHTAVRETFVLEPVETVSRVRDYGVEAPTVSTLEPEVVCVESAAEDGFHRWTLPTVEAVPADLAIDGSGRVVFTEYAAGRLGRLEPGADGLADGIFDAVARIVALLAAADPPGRPGMVRKIERVASQVEQGRLTTALATLAAFDRQLVAKISNGQLGEPEASEISLLVAGIDRSIRRLPSVSPCDPLD